MLPFVLVIAVGLTPPTVELTLAESRPLGYAKTHHVQGLAIDSKRVYVSSVERATSLGWLFVLNRASLTIESTHRLALASQFHPGGMQLRDGRLYLPLAEYRPLSSASLLIIDLSPLDDPNKSQRRVAIRSWTSIDDHIGSIAVDPAGRMFIANWFVTEDHTSESGLWVHDNIHIGEACDIIGDVPEVSKADLDRIVRPERCLTLDQIDRHPVLKVMGKQADEALKRRT